MLYFFQFSVKYFYFCLVLFHTVHLFKKKKHLVVVVTLPIREKMRADIWKQVGTKNLYKVIDSCFVPRLLRTEVWDS